MKSRPPLVDGIFFKMRGFYPRKIYIDRHVENLPVTRRILAKYPLVPKQIIADRRQIKVSWDHTRAKHTLFLAKFQGEALRPCQGMGDSVCCGYHTVALISDCHLECTYCILQDYLKNNPVITIHTNIEEIFSEISKQLRANPDKILRIGTGELSDSLALDPVTGFSRDLIDFANGHKNVIVELKTKTDNISNLLNLKHCGNVVVSWSVNPQSIIEKEEHKCASLTARLSAARQCANRGFPVGFHFDPLLYFEGWEKKYKTVIDQIAEQFTSSQIAWISLGTLRFTPGLKKIVNARFPKSTIMTGELYPGRDGKMRTFRPIRERMYAALSGWIKDKLNHTPHYLCMETKTVWQNIFGFTPENSAALEHQLTQNFKFAV